MNSTYMNSSVLTCTLTICWTTFPVLQQLLASWDSWRVEFGPKGTKLYFHIDTGTVKLSSDTNTLSGIYSTYKPPQFGVPMAFNSPHKLNSNSVIPAGSYGHSINLHPQPNTPVLVVVVSSSSATSVRSDQWNLIKLNLLTCISHLLIEVYWSGDPKYVCCLCNALSPKFWSSVNTQDNGISMNL